MRPRRTVDLLRSYKILLDGKAGRRHHCGDFAKSYYRFEDRGLCLACCRNSNVSNEGKGDLLRGVAINLFVSYGAVMVFTLIMILVFLIVAS